MGCRPTHDAPCRGVLFSHRQRDKSRNVKICSFGTSKNIWEYEENLDSESLSHTVSVRTRHIDGSMNSQERNGILQWLAEEPDNERECRVVTNVRCLSEGVDVPSLDAVLFLSARNSQVDVVQSVGRVMRTFHKGQSDEKSMDISSSLL